MQIVATGDIHFRETNPVCRLDNYCEQTQMDKFTWILEETNKLSDPVLVLPGDVFDSYKVGDKIKVEVLEILSEFDFPVLCIAGQHDMKYHSLESVPETPLGVLIAAKAVKYLKIDCYQDKDKNVFLYGSSFGEEIPKFLQKTRALRILVIHKMISDKDYWQGYLKYNDSKQFLIDHPDFDLVISGDNHQAFVTEFENRYLINCGSMGRTTIAQVDHRPMIAIYDTQKRTVKKKYIPIKPSSEVMRMIKPATEDINREYIEKFIESLKENPHMKMMNFLDRLKARVAWSGMDKEIERIIWEALEDKDGR